VGEGLRNGVRVWRTDPMLQRSLVMFVTIAAFSVVPEALAVAFVDEADLPDVYVGLVIAAGAAWSLIVMALLPDLDSDEELLASASARTARYGAGAAVLFAVVAVVTGAIDLFGDGVAGTAVVATVAMVAYAVAGGLDSIGVPTNQVVGRRLPLEGRTAAMSVGMGAAYSAQAVTMVIVGAIATVVPVAVVLSGSMVVAAGLSFWFARAQQPADRPVSSSDAHPARS